jgi:hypothetical protein
MTESKPKEQDPYWWTPWAVLVALLLYGLLGFLGVLTPKRSGPTAADVAPPSAASPPPVAEPKPSAPAKE